MDMVARVFGSGVVVFASVESEERNQKTKEKELFHDNFYVKNDGLIDSRSGAVKAIKPVFD